MKKGSLVVNFYEIFNEDLSSVNEAEFNDVSFQARDFLLYLERPVKLVEIESIRVDRSCRRQGHGSEMLKALCTGKEDTIIIAAAGALTSEFKEEPTREQYKALFSDLDKFYTHNGFVDVTATFGTYDGTSKRTYLYQNDIGKELLRKAGEKGV